MRDAPSAGMQEIARREIFFPPIAPAIMNLNVYQNYPNPANPYTTIEYRVGETGSVRIQLYDIYGRKIRDIFDGEQNAGLHQLKIDVSDLPDGGYYYSIQNEENIASGHFIVVK